MLDFDHKERVHAGVMDDEVVDDEDDDEEEEEDDEIVDVTTDVDL